MKIAILAHLHYPIREPYLGGTEMHTAMIADEFVRRGHDVTLFAKQGSRTRARLIPLLDRDWTFGRVRHPDGTDRTQDDLRAAVSGAIRTIKADGFDAVVNNSFGPLPYTDLPDAAMLTVLHTPPTLRRVNEVIRDPHWRPGPRHAWVGVSQFNTDLWRPDLPAARCVPNGIYLHHWADRGRVEDGLAVWTGRITPEKGLREAIAAVRHAGIRLEFSGPISDPVYFEEHIRPELDDQVDYLGHRDHSELAELLQRGAVFVSAPQWDEPFGLVMVEAMACGTPVAALPRGAAAEVLGTAGGALAREDTIESLAEAIKIAHDLDRDGVRANAERFSAGLMMDRYEAILTDLIR